MNEHLLIGDLHIGNNKNNPQFFKIALDYANWVKKICEERNIKHIIQMGDVFHDRTSLNLQAIQCAYDFFTILKDYKISIITGNHDVFYLDNNSVHSLSLFKNWPNITIYDTPTVTEWFVFLPWGIEQKKMPCGKIGIGHLEIAGYNMSKNKICTDGLRGVEVMENFEMLFSGHFHKPQERKYSKKKFIYTGSAFQLNWGESDEDKFIYIVNPETLEIEKIKNTVSPRFEYIRSIADYGKIPNNFVAVDLLNNVESETIIRQIQALKPLDMKTEFKEMDITDTKNIIDEFKIVNIGDAITEFSLSMINLTNVQQKMVADEIKLLYSSLL